MARKSIYEILAEQGFDPHEEYLNLKVLFEDESIYKHHSFFQCITPQYFRQFPNRGRYLSLEEMQSAVNYYAHLHRYSELDFLLLYCEFITFAMEQCFHTEFYEDFSEYGSSPLFVQKEIIENQIEKILEQAGYQWTETPNEQKMITEKNRLATEAAELASTNEEATNILEYNHFSLKGDIEGKKKILKALADSIEPILNEFKNNNVYAQLSSDTRFILNNFNIRHNNTDGANAKEFVKKMKPEELEQWYDKAYNCILAVIILNEQISTRKDISDLKAQYNL